MASLAAMEILRAVVLGLVQGLTEFVPVSSSGHLVLVPYLLGWQSPGLAFDVALHFGTLAAVVGFFRAELMAMARGLLGLDRSSEGLLYRRLALLLIAASVPIAIVGLLFEDAVGALFESPVAASGFLLLTAALLLGGERWRDRRVVAGARPPRVEALAAATGGAGRPVWTGDWRGSSGEVPSDAIAAVPGGGPTRLPTGVDPKDPAGLDLAGLGVRQALVIGLGQCVAILPGVSRSGATITAGLVSGLTREAATRFSFLLALPALIGAGVLKLPDLAQPGPFGGVAIAAGVTAAGLSGYAAIRFLLRLVAHDRLSGFAYYCIAASVVGLLGYLMNGPPG